MEKNAIPMSISRPIRDATSDQSYVYVGVDSSGTGNYFGEFVLPPRAMTGIVQKLNTNWNVVGTPQAGEGSIRLITEPKGYKTSIRGFCFAWDPFVTPGTPKLYAVGNTEGYLAFPLASPPDGSARSNMGKEDGFITLIGTNQGDRGLKFITTTQIGGIERDEIGACTVEFDGVKKDGMVFTIGTTAGSVPGGRNLGGDDLFMSRYDLQLNLDYNVQWGTSANDFSYAPASSSPASLPGQGVIYAQRRQTGGGNTSDTATTNTGLVWAAMSQGR